MLDVIHIQVITVASTSTHNHEQRLLASLLDACTFMFPCSHKSVGPCRITCTLQRVQVKSVDTNHGHIPHTTRTNTRTRTQYQSASSPIAADFKDAWVIRIRSVDVLGEPVVMDILTVDEEEKYVLFM